MIGHALWTLTMTPDDFAHEQDGGLSNKDK